jgi:hypothetical protein
MADAAKSGFSDELGYEKRLALKLQGGRLDRVSVFECYSPTFDQPSP